MADMVEKVKVACAARRNPEETLIIARTDARQTEGLEAAIARGRAYGAAGADVVFVEALHSIDEMRLACDRIDQPMMANMADGGATPILSASELADLGYAMAIYPSMTGLAAAAAVEKALLVMKSQGTSSAPGLDLFEFGEFNRLIGFPEVWEFDRKWARRDPSDAA
jgi:2-methylisocitrate lyase-like PEP mutase family enzyme